MWITTTYATLGADADYRVTESGKTLTKLNLCVSQDIKQQDGTWEKRPPHWYNAIGFGVVADNLAELAKGERIKIIKGKYEAKTYKDKEGKNRVDHTVVIMEWEKVEKRNQ